MSIEIVKIDRNNKKELREFLNLPIQLYGDAPVIRNAILKTEGLLKVPYEVGLYLARDQNQTGKTVGRMALYVNAGICDETGRPYGQVGLFEVIEDFDVYRAMLDFAKREYKELPSFLFPFYVSTWYQYRFITRKDFYFFFEIPNKPYYPEFAKRYGIDQTYSYMSLLAPAIKENEWGIIKYEKLIEEGYTFRNVNKRKFKEEMRVMYDLSTMSFQHSRFYTGIPFEEFMALFQDSWKMVDEDLFIIVMHGDRPVGFCFTTPDYTPLYEKLDLHSSINKIRLFLSRNRANGCIVKTVATHPEYRRKGLLTSMFYYTVVKAREKGYRYLIGATTAVDNYPAQYPRGVEKMNGYDVYTIKI